MLFKALSTLLFFLRASFALEKTDSDRLSIL